MQRLWARASVSRVRERRAPTKLLLLDEKCATVGGGPGTSRGAVEGKGGKSSTEILRATRMDLSSDLARSALGRALPGDCEVYQRA